MIGRILLIASLVFTVTAFDCGGSGGGAKLTVQPSTPNGINLSASRTPSIELKQAIDEAATRIFELARSRGYGYGLDFAAYKIHLLDGCVLSPEGKTPSFRLRADSYDGTEFDQNPAPGIGEILAAEQVITVFNEPVPEFVICHDADLAYIKEATHNGFDHLILWANDRDEYHRTAHHGGGITHPLIK